jgi:MFS family permease
MSRLPRPGPLRLLASIVVTAAVAGGVYLTSGILYFTRIVHISAGEVGWGFTAAGAACILASIASGWACDRLGPGRTLLWCLCIAATGTFAIPAAQTVAAFCLIVPLVSAAQTSVQVVVSTFTNRLFHENANEVRGYVRAALNVGYSIGAALSGVAAQWDSPTVYQLLFVADSLALFATVALAAKLPTLPPLAARPTAVTGRALRDKPYLALTAVDGVLSLQHRIQSVVIPLWILTATCAPRWTIAAADIANTLVIVTFQVRACRGIDSPAAGARAWRRCGWVFAAACALIPESSGRSALVAGPVLLGGALVLAVGELWQSAAGFELSNSLAAPDAIGEYLGVFGAGLRSAETAGPALLTWLCIGYGRIGWYVVGLVLLVTGVASPAVTRWAQRTRPVPSTV